MKKKVIIIGAGFSGLAASAELAGQGFDVTVIEKHDIPGGRARNFSAAGFTFDLGPSWYWLPDVFEKFFARFGKKPEDYYQLLRLDPSYKVFYAKDDTLNIPSGHEKVAEVFEKTETGSGKKLLKYLSEAEKKYKIGINKLVYKPALSIFEYLDLEVLTNIPRFKILSNIYKYNRSVFRNPRLFPLLEFPVIFLGATPKRTPALYSLMNYADMVLGTWYPMGGMYSVVDAMYRLAVEQGVNFVFSTDVESIITDQGRATGVKAGNREIPADFVLASADYHHVESKLLGKEEKSYSEKYWESREMAPSSLLFYLGISKKLDKLEHHNLFLDEDFDQHAEDLFDHKQWPKNPLLYISVTSKTDASVAPQGQENMVILIPVAPGLKDTPETRQKYLDYSIKKIEKLTGESFAENIIYHRSYAHNDFAADYNAFKGNAYGLGNTLMQTAIFKPKMKSKKVRNLFYAGQLTSPGPGVPPSIISGLVAANLIINEKS